jgi:hypothetical protein
MCSEEKRLKITGQYGMFLWSLHPTAVQMLLVDCVLDPDATVTFMFRIRDMLVRIRVRIRILDPYLRLTDPAPDRSLFVGDVQFANRIIFSKFLCLFLYEGTYIYIIL